MQTRYRSFLAKSFYFTQKKKKKKKEEKKRRTSNSIETVVKIASNEIEIRKFSNSHGNTGAMVDRSGHWTST